jgi:hypothetical protein
MVNIGYIIENKAARIYNSVASEKVISTISHQVYLPVRQQVYDQVDWKIYDQIMLPTRNRLLIIEFNE